MSIVRSNGRWRKNVVITYPYILLQINEDTIEKITNCNEQLKMPEGKLINTLQSCAELLRDDHYVRETLAIDNIINVMSENN